MVNNIILLVIGIITTAPLINVVSKSFSSDDAIISGRVYLLPVHFQIESYKFVILKTGFLRSFEISVFITVVGTICCLIMSALTAYPLSKPKLPGRKFVLLLYVVAMLFYGGMISSYLLMRTLKLLDNLWSIILPHLIVTFNMLIIKNYFEELPESIEEAAKIEGASNFRIFHSIVLPLSKPVLAVVALFYAVGFWNNYFHAMLFLSKPQLRPLQVYLYDLLLFTENPDANLDQHMLNLQSIKSTTIVTSTVPILLVYPYLQKYFIKGIIVGSLKG